MPFINLLKMFNICVNRRTQGQGAMMVVSVGGYQASEKGFGSRSHQPPSRPGFPTAD